MSRENREIYMGPPIKMPPSRFQSQNVHTFLLDEVKKNFSFCKLDSKESDTTIKYTGHRRFHLEFVS